MTSREELQKARALIAGGWSEPDSRDTSGRPCGAFEEGISRFCLMDALLLSASRVTSVPVLIQALEAVACPIKVAIDRAADEVLAVPEGQPAPAQVERVLSLFRSSKPEKTYEDVFDWCAKPERKLAEVLQVFDRALAQVRP